MYLTIETMNALIKKVILTDEQKGLIEWGEATIIEDDHQSYFFTTETESIRVYTPKQQKEINEYRRDYHAHVEIGSHSIAKSLADWIQTRYSFDITQG